MITTEQEEAIVEGIANANLNAFNINGMLEAARFYALHLAKTSVANMSPEEKEKVLNEIEEAQKKAEEAQAEEEKASDSESDS